MGQGKIIENRIERLHIAARIDQLRGEERLLTAAVDIGGLYDTHPGAMSGTGERDESLALKAGLGYQLPLDGKFGFRVDYSGYADFHGELSEFDIQEHQFAIEPMFTSGQLVYSLQLGATRMFENGRHDADGIIISPALTRLMDSESKAIAVYGHAAKIEDKNAARALNEDRKSFGGGLSYFFTSGETGSALISIGYSKADFETSIRDFDPTAESNDKRSDKAVTANINLSTRIALHMGLYASYSYNNARSNVATYDYRRHILEAGISVFY